MYMYVWVHIYICYIIAGRMKAATDTFANKNSCLSFWVHRKFEECIVSAF